MQLFLPSYVLVFVFWTKFSFLFHSFSLFDNFSFHVSSFYGRIGQDPLGWFTDGGLGWFDRKRVLEGCCGGQSLFCSLCLVESELRLVVYFSLALMKWGITNGRCRGAWVNGWIVGRASKTVFAVDKWCGKDPPQIHMLNLRTERAPHWLLWYPARHSLRGLNANVVHSELHTQYTIGREKHAEKHAIIFPSLQSHLMIECHARQTPPWFHAITPFPQ